MSSVLLYHHLGLGDHFMCHGIVREYCKKYDRVAIFSKHSNHPSVSFMYRDIPNLTIIKGDDPYARKFIYLNKFKFGNYKYNEIKIIGFENLSKTSGVHLEQQFYALAGIHLEKKWESFYVARNLEREHAFLERMVSKNDFVFIHEDPSREFSIKRDGISKDYAIITPQRHLTDNIFDYCTIIERAKEIHVIDSSFMFLIDCLPYTNPDQKLFVHRYARPNPDWQLPILKKNWQIVTN